VVVCKDETPRWGVSCLTLGVERRRRAGTRAPAGGEAAEEDGCAPSRGPKPQRGSARGGGDSLRVHHVKPPRGASPRLGFFYFMGVGCY
jgi:hypothetical protein